MPGSSMAGVTMQAWLLLAVAVVTMSAPRTAWITDAARRSVSPGTVARLRCSRSLAAGAMSNTRSSSMPSSA